ncbi:RdgB/HAM1 family non-canonical purine NTP pyrophosphatase [candidate division KSB1 bacterium]
MRLALATANRHKVREIADILKGLPVTLITPADYPEYVPPEETGATFLQNAALKAVAFARETGLPCLADDSGLEVRYLDGRPGVRSARYAGPEDDYRANNEKLLAELKGIPPEKRGGAFRCVIVLYDPGRRIVAPTLRRRQVDGELMGVFEGRVEGVIAAEPRGSAGFGYDPLFIWPPAGLTFAQMTPEAKNAVSHRAAALEKFAGFLKSAEIA